MFSNRFIRILPLVFLLSGCETTPDTPTSTSEIKANPKTIVSEQRKDIAQIAPLTTKELDDVWQRIRAQLTFANSSHPAVQQRIAWYLSHPHYMDEISRRAEPYLYHIVSEVEKRELPIELALMPLIESDFNASAYSHKHASGLWQLTPAIAKYFKVQITPWYDGRQDVIDSTRAALDFMVFYGVVDFTPVTQAAWLAMPNFTAPEFNINAILFMIPVAIAPAVEHVGDMLAISNVTGKNYLKKPGLHRTIAGDGVATK